MSRDPTKVLLGLFSIFALAPGPAFGQTLAITEFVVEPFIDSGPPNTSSNPEFLEIFNYGNTIIDLEGIGVTDNSYDDDTANRPLRSFIFPAGASIDPGEYVIITREVAEFETAWPGIAGQVQIFDWDTEAGSFAFSQNGDQAIIFDSGGTFEDLNNPGFLDKSDDTVLWSAAYDAGTHTQGVSFYLADSDNFAVTDYGRKGDLIGDPGIVLEGNDDDASGASTGVAGYENSAVANGAFEFSTGNVGSPGNVTPIALTADFDADTDVDGNDFLLAQLEVDPAAAVTAWDGEFGSGAGPLTAVATAIPEPSSALLLACGVAYVASRRRRAK